jgi:SAM-dependent methyltransferase
VKLIRVAKELLPPSIRLALRRLRARFTLHKNIKRSPKEVFTEIYERCLWSEYPDVERTSGYFSGPGSDEFYGVPYANAVSRFISQNNIDSVIDLGCGDFRVGQLLTNAPIHYVGVDVVEKLIEHNTANHSSENVEFRCLDITRDHLPTGHLCLLREVLQHLSNKQIAAVLKSVSQYRFCIVTDCQPADLNSFKPNVDKPAGPQSHAFFRSGLRLDKPPFNMTDVSVFLELPVRDRPMMTMRSFLISNDESVRRSISELNERSIASSA